jgi:hypothetical protein
LSPPSGQILFHLLVLQICWRKNIKDKKKNIVFLLIWDKDSYTGRCMLWPCIYVVQPKLVHFYQTSSLLSGPLPIVASASLKFLYSMSTSTTFKFLVSFPFLILPVHVLPLVYDPCPIILLHLF